MSNYLKGIGMAFLSLLLAAVVACGGAAPAPAEEAMAVEEDAATNTGFIDRQLPNPTSEVLHSGQNFPMVAHGVRQLGSILAPMGTSGFMTAAVLMGSMVGVRPILISTRF